MPVPKYRTSASKRNMRRSHHALKAPGLSLCPNCQEIKLPHTACKACGHYKNIQVLEPKKTDSSWDDTNFEAPSPNKTEKEAPKSEKQENKQEKTPIENKDKDKDK